VLSPRDKLIEDFGLYFEQYGLPRILGRIYGLLMITDEAVLGLDAMAEQLNISKASASTTARQLQAFTLIEKVSLPGDRRDYYRVAPDAHAKYLRTTLEKSLQFSSLIESAARIENLSSESHAKLEQIKHLYEALTETIRTFFEHYQFENPDDPTASQKPAAQRTVKP
jgi:DNA-binding transcriptional regulator GbsR (MarR family)